MIESREKGRSWEEDTYWNHFRTIRFLQFLRSDFDQQLAIPEEVARNLKKKLDKTVIIKGPSNLTWSVGTTEKEGTLFFQQNWPQFVKDHQLKENDVLVFKYDGDSCFHVLMFNGRSQCEEASSYFVEKSEQTSHKTAERKARKNSVDVVSDSSHSNNESSPPEGETNNGVKRRSAGRRAANHTSRKRIRQGSTSGKLLCQRRSERQKALFASANGKNTNHDAGDASVSENVNTSLTYASTRRNATQEEKEKAIHLAEASTTSASFGVVMKPSHVYKGFFVSIPQLWITKHLTLNDQDVILQLNEKSWKVKFKITKPKCGGLSGGWRNFAEDNKLEEHDLCVFKLPNPEIKPVVLNVSIFRAASKVVSPRH